VLSRIRSATRAARVIEGERGDAEKTATILLAMLAKEPA
jgi:hypothetical protein